MRTRSIVTNRIYEQEGMVYIMNPLQIAKYLKYGCTLYDLFESNDKLVGVFSRKETQPLYEKWQVRAL